MSRRPPSFPQTLRCGFGAGAALLTIAAQAQTQAPPPAASPSLTPLLFGLLLVLALIPAAAWLLRRAGLAQATSVTGLRVVAQIIEKVSAKNLISTLAQVVGRRRAQNLAPIVSQR